MRKVLLFGYFGFNNFGDEWLLKTSIKLLNISAERKNFFVLYNIKEKITVEENVTYIPRWDFIEILKSISQVDTVVSLGGLFQDKTSRLSLLYYLLILFLAKIFNKKIFVLNTEIDVKKIPKSFVVSILNFFADNIFVRNKDDLKYSKKAKFCPDICIYDFEEEKVFVSETVNTIGMIVKQIKDFEILKTMCEVLSKQYRIVFIPFHVEEDYPFCLKLLSRINNGVIRVWDKVGNYRNIFSDIDLIITSRLHGVIIAAVLCKPFICISEEEKVKKMIKSMFMIGPISLSFLGQKNFSIQGNIFYPEVNKIKEYKTLVLRNFISLF